MTDQFVHAPFWVVLQNSMTAIRFSFDHGCTHALSFRVFSACQLGDSSWELIDNMEPRPLAQWEEAFCEIDGDLKWDGCINWQTNPECMMHGCGPSHINQITNIFTTVYHVGKRFNDLLDDPVPDLPSDAVEIAETES